MKRIMSPIVPVLLIASLVFAGIIGCGGSARKLLVNGSSTQNISMATNGPNFSRMDHASLSQMDDVCLAGGWHWMMAG